MRLERTRDFPAYCQANATGFFGSQTAGRHRTGRPARAPRSESGREDQRHSVTGGHVRKRDARVADKWADSQGSCVRQPLVGSHRAGTVRGRAATRLTRACPRPCARPRAARDSSTAIDQTRLIARVAQSISTNHTKSSIIDTTTRFSLALHGQRQSKSCRSVSLRLPRHRRRIRHWCFVRSTPPSRAKGVAPGRDSPRRDLWGSRSRARRRAQGTAKQAQRFQGLILTASVHRHFQPARVAAR
jgi:hypothetical protein